MLFNLSFNNLYKINKTKVGFFIIKRFYCSLVDSDNLNKDGLKSRFTNKVIEFDQCYFALGFNYIVNYPDRKLFIPFDDLVDEFRLKLKFFTHNIYFENNIDEEKVNNFFNSFLRYLDNIYLIETYSDDVLIVLYTDILREYFGETINFKESDDFFYETYKNGNYLIDPLNNLNKFKLLLKKWHFKLIQCCNLSNFKNIEDQINFIIHMLLDSIDTLNVIYSELNESRKKMDLFVDQAYLLPEYSFVPPEIEQNINIIKEYNYSELKNYFKEKFTLGIMVLFRLRNSIGLRKYFILFYSSILLDLQKNIKYLPDSVNINDNYSEIVSSITLLLDNVNSLSDEILMIRHKTIQVIIRDIFCFVFAFF